MNIIDAAILVLLALGAVLGFKRGLTKQLAMGAGGIAIFILAFIFKTPVSEFLYQKLPFFDFWGIFKGVSALNILLYEIIAFLIVLAGLSIVLKVIIAATSLFEKLLNATIVLGIPSKILGMIVGIVEYYVIVFGILFVISLPIIDFDFIDESKWKDKILENTPILTPLSNDTTLVFEEFVELKDKYSEDATSSNEFNLEAIDLFLKYNVIDVESVNGLIEQGKLDIDGIEDILEKYSEVEE